MHVHHPPERLASCCQRWDCKYVAPSGTPPVVASLRTDVHGALPERRGQMSTYGGLDASISAERVKEGKRAGLAGGAGTHTTRRLLSSPLLQLRGLGISRA